MSAVLYVGSFGPACRLAAHGGGPPVVLLTVYRPIVKAADVHDRDANPVSEAIWWWAHLWGGTDALIAAVVRLD